MDDLKKLQAKYEQLARTFIAGRLKLESDFAKTCSPLFERRRKIVTGEAEPTAEELGEELKEESASDDAGGKKKGQAKGVPSFWLTVLQKHDTAAEFVQKRDEACLKYIKDIRCTSPKDAAAGFRLEIEFAPNPYFLDRFLIKEVVVEDVEGDEPGSKVQRIQLKESTEISWKGDENNLTITVKKGGGGGKSKGDKKGKGKKGKGAEDASAPIAPATRTKPCASFFNLFSLDRNLRGRRGQPGEQKGRGKGKGRGRADEGEEDDEGDDAGVYAGAAQNEEGEGYDAGGGDWIPPDHLEFLQAFQQDIVNRAIEIYLQEGFDGDRGQSADGAEQDDEDEVEFEEYPEPKAEAEQDAQKTDPSLQRNEAIAKRIKALEHLQERLQAAQRVRDEGLSRLRSDLQDKAAPLLAQRTDAIVGPKARKSGAHADMALPRFWLLALKGCPVTVELIRRRDVPLLSLLADIRAVPKRRAEGDVSGPVLAVEFEFLGGIEEWMQERVLSLTFTFSAGADGDLIAKCEGSGIRWKEDMEVTLKEVESKKGGIQLKKCPSFFHLFLDESRHFAFVGDDSVRLTGEELRGKETELAYALRDSILPDPVSLYAITQEWAGDEDDEEEDEDGEGDDDEEEDEDVGARAELARRAAVKGGRGKKGRRRGDDDDDGRVFGMSRSTALMVLMILMMSTPVLIFLEQIIAYISH